MNLSLLIKYLINNNMNNKRTHLPKKRTQHICHGIVKIFGLHLHHQSDKAIIFKSTNLTLILNTFQQHSNHMNT